MPKPRNSEIKIFQNAESGPRNAEMYKFDSTIITF